MANDLPEEFEEFHTTASKKVSDRVAELLERENITFDLRVINEIGRPEYVIAVRPDDLVRANQAFWNDVGPGRTFTSGAGGGTIDE